MTFELLSLAVFFGFSLGLLAWVLLNSLQEVQDEAEEAYDLYSTSPFFKLLVPLLQYTARRLEPVRPLEGMRGGLRKKLMHAGKTLAMTPDEFIALMLVCAGIGALVALYFDRMLDLRWPYLTAIVLIVTFLPLLNLNDRIGRRQKAIRKILPYTLDLLCLAVEAGLDFTAALNRIGENLKDNPFRDELRLLSRDLTMGKSRRDALRDLEKRCGVEELTAVVSALVQADELGASLGPVLRIQSEDLQRKRFQRAEKKAMEAPVLMLIPLVLFIFPLVFLIIFTPIGLQIMDQM